MGYKLGLAISIIIGVLVATFPLYSDNISGYIWNLNTSSSSEGSETTYTLQGTVEEVDVNESIIVVNGVEIKVLGAWITPNGTEIESQDLLKLIKPGDQVTVVYSQRGKWSYKLEEITIEPTGEHYVKSS
ncbi:MAG: hypothetical protein GSR72_07725 [Desulfurococcales archaeon]|nr:hypothetical protein [Desulfurococcales archaeon]MEB3789761.1 hypothetical protein [Desulfurococcales archaeon]